MPCAGTATTSRAIAKRRKKALGIMRLYASSFEPRSNGRFPGTAAATLRKGHAPPQFERPDFAEQVRCANEDRSHKSKEIFSGPEQSRCALRAIATEILLS